MFLLSKEIDGGLDSFFKGHLWFPAQDALGLAAIEVGHVDIARTLWRSYNLWFITGQLCQGVVDFVDGGGFACCDVEDIVVGFLEGENVGTSYVLYKHVVFALPTVPVDAYWFMSDKTLGENRNNPCFAVGVLARTIHVAVA